MTAAALILAAGEGTRMKSDLPKVAHALLGLPMISLVLDAADTAGLDPVVVVTGHGAEAVEEIVSGRTTVRQEEQFGTGHAVMCAREALAGLAGSLVVLSGDTPLLRAETIRELVAARERSDAAVSVLTARMDDPTGYGRIVRGDSGAVDAIVEQKELALGQEDICEVNTGTYCFDVETLFAHLDALTTDNAQEEYYLTDMIGHFAEEGLTVTAVVCEDPAEPMGVNTRVQLAQAGRLLQRRVNEGFMLAGVTMIDPDLVWVSPSVEVGRDVTLEPMTFLMGATSIGEGAHIGPNSRVTDSVVGRGARVDSSVLLGARVGAGTKVGPMAYLRPGTELAQGAKAGTFVELKNAQVGEGSKIPHLSYVGDATIGVAVNVGAGSITCNYDGESKHATEIGDGAFIGSDTMFVAPVKVGSGAVVGAGSVITEDVPDDALGVARGRQKNFEGWAADWRARRSRREKSEEREE